MIRSKLWRAKREKVRQVHVWRPRRSWRGELSRFVRRDSTEENMKLLWSYLEKFGHPLTFYTDKASRFRTAAKHKRDESWSGERHGGNASDADRPSVAGIGNQLDSAHSPAKGRVERNFETAQDRLVKGMRAAGVKTIEQATSI